MTKGMLALFLLNLCLTLIGCLERLNLAEASFGKPGQRDSRASDASVISMGRDDEEGKAKRLHIGGAFD